MFVQIHMLQSVPPGNLNRDETGQPKKCIFGGVTRGRISSQCLKRNIRHSMQFKEAYGDALSVGTTYLPRMMADALKEIRPDFPQDELDTIKAALAGKFKAEKRGGSESAEEESDDQGQPQSASAPSDTTDQTGQRVSFPPPFAKEIARLIVDLKDSKADVYNAWVSGKKSDREKQRDDIREFEEEIFKTENVKPNETAPFFN